MDGTWDAIHSRLSGVCDLWHIRAPDDYLPADPYVIGVVRLIAGGDEHEQRLELTLDTHGYGDDSAALAVEECVRDIHRALTGWRILSVDGASSELERELAEWIEEDDVRGKRVRMIYNGVWLSREVAATRQGG